MRRFLLLISFICLFHSTNQSLAQPLRWNLQEGQELSVDISQTTTTTAAISVRSVQSEYEMNMSLDWKVQAASDETFTIEQTISRLAINGKRGANVVVALDTDKKPTRTLVDAERDLYKAITALVGQTFVVEMTARGKINDVQIPEKMLDALRDVPASMRIRQIFTDEGYKEIFGKATLQFPEEQVEADHSWQETETIESQAGQFEIKHTYTINKSLSDQSAQIDVASQVTALPPSDPEAQPMTVKSQSASGKIVFDRQQGLITSATMKTNLVTEKPYQKETITSTINSEITLTITAK